MENKTVSNIVRPDLSFAKVLVVDDFKMNLDTAALLLRKYKLQVDCVGSGREAVDRVESGEPVYNVIFMDLLMPGMDGIEAARLIRSLNTEYAQSVPIIALTADDSEGNEQLFLENGFQAFRPKPLSMAKLDTVLKKWIPANP
jgi:CheY-like chemotaxis protein